MKVSSEMWPCAAWYVVTEVSEEISASIFTVEDLVQRKKLYGCKEREEQLLWYTGNSAFCPHSVFVCSVWFSQ
jgi:hypothetical protein